MSTSSEYIRTLAEQAKLPDNIINPKTEVAHYYNLAQGWFMEAANTTSLERKYFNLLRMVSLLWEHLPRHPDYRKYAKWHDVTRKRCESVMDQLEQIKLDLRVQLMGLESAPAASSNNNDNNATVVASGKTASVEENEKFADASATPTPSTTVAPPPSYGIATGSQKVASPVVPPPSYGSSVAATSRSAPSAGVPSYGFSAGVGRGRGIVPAVVPALPPLYDPYAKTAVAPVAKVSSPMPVAVPAPVRAPVRVAEPVKPPATFSLKMRGVRVGERAFRDFAKAVQSNTSREKETCGILCGKSVNEHLVLTHIVLPPQRGSSDMVEMTDEGVLLDFQLQHDLMCLGWIHTHPTQSCFLSSIDMHTSAAYQVMLDEALAVVVAPKEGIGVFRLTPFGLKLLLQCPLRGFHAHREPDLYRQASSDAVFFDPALPCTIVDLR